MMPLYAATNIAGAAKSFGKRGYASLKGLIFNAKNFEGEAEIVGKAAEEIGTEVICRLPRDRRCKGRNPWARRLWRLFRSASSPRSARLWQKSSSELFNNQQGN
jgi:nitrogenase subunit NifH